ncbi:Beta-lactamase [Sulfidibacter corallicola]|uniref:Beta-lactamase n=1 Tax=Sulfidibacter corallicola TaxID=2818388 RepID=A0A8A4TFW2_SULCO|nr:penicillin-binding transpeptidase domain-containing protein [Sulfidibacter corallicola]QTD47598.1 class D beta-lactamase [Sulfidibacter corallicola]
MKPIFHSILAVLAATCFPLQASETHRTLPSPDFAKIFENHQATFVMKELESGQMWRFNDEALDRGCLPCSTFKIPHSIIGLELGILQDADTKIKRDPLKFPAEDWWPRSWERSPATLRQAMKHSIVWYYRTLAGHVGPKRMQQWLTKFDYGNGDFSAGPDIFWIKGDFAISPNEQLDFMERFYREKLGVSEKTTAILKDVLVLDNQKDYRFSGKTGLCTMPDKKKVGWLVGYLERGPRTFVYVLKLEGDTFDQIKHARIELVKAVLRHMNLMS